MAKEFVVFLDVSMQRYFTVVSWKHFLHLRPGSHDIQGHVISSLQIHIVIAQRRKLNIFEVIKRKKYSSQSEQQTNIKHRKENRILVNIAGPNFARCLNTVEYKQLNIATIIFPNSRNIINIPFIYQKLIETQGVCFTLRLSSTCTLDEEKQTKTSEVNEICCVWMFSSFSSILITEGALVQIHDSSYWGGHMQQTLRQQDKEKKPSRHIFQWRTPLTVLWCCLWASSLFFLPWSSYGCNILRRAHVRLQPASGFRL